MGDDNACPWSVLGARIAICDIECPSQVQAVGKHGLKGRPKAGESEYLELHGVFSIGLHAPGTDSISRSGYVACAPTRGLPLKLLLLVLRALRGVPAEEGDGRRQRRLKSGRRLPPSLHFVFVPKATRNSPTEVLVL